MTLSPDIEQAVNEWTTSDFPIDILSLAESFQREIRNNYNTVYSYQMRDLFEYIRLALKCQSACEALLFWQFVKDWGLTCRDPLEDSDFDGFDITVPVSLAKTTCDPLGFFLQTEIDVGSYKIHADFTVECWDGERRESVTICIEVDGHDFHERTKQQAQRDKSRDRLLTAKGYRVLRFTGSEIWKEPAKIVTEVEDVIRAI